MKKVKCCFVIQLIRDGNSRGRKYEFKEKSGKAPVGKYGVDIIESDSYIKSGDFELCKSIATN
jgi:hypothetical protein